MCRVGGPPGALGAHQAPPFWSLTNIKHVAADITRGAADISCGAANISCGAADISRGVSDISRGAADICLPKTHFFPFFENFSKCFGNFQVEKYTFFQKFSKIGLVAEKLMITFRGGGARPKRNQDYFFLFCF